MSGTFRQRLIALGALGVVVGAAGCSDLLTRRGDTLALNQAFQSVPVGFSAASQSFSANADIGEPFLPGAMDPAMAHHGRGQGGMGPGAGQGGQHGAGRGPGDHRDGFGPGVHGVMMGGGLGPDFMGVFGFGRGRGRGPFGTFNLPDDCTYSDESGRVTCPEHVRHGLTVNVSFAFKDADGDAQPAFDTITTNSVNVRTAVSGTISKRHGQVTSTVSHASDRTVTGLAAGSTERVVNGTSRAEEVTTGTRDSVAFTATRLAGDTTTDVTIPIVDGKPTFPASGTVVRSMKISITPEGGETVTHTRREVVTYDGSDVAKVTITQDDVTKQCTVTLPRGRLICE